MTLTAQTTFCQLCLTGTQAAEFLQGQLTADVSKVSGGFLPTAICNLKGRVDFGLWVKKNADGFALVLAADCADALAAHIKKYGAFSKIALSVPQPAFLALSDSSAAPTFSQTEQTVDASTWLRAMLSGGQSVITAVTRSLYQPQELRLHQLGGVHYDKGCYLGQEVVARLWFKAAPKAWLHLVKGAGCALESGTLISEHIQVVNSLALDDGFVALVVARPESLDMSGLTVLDLPEGLGGSAAKA